MDRVLWEQHLTQAEIAVALSQWHIARQKELIAELKRLGSETETACALLAEFETMQELHVAHRDWLREDLSGGA